jgi:hypothetical protein
MRPFNVDFDTPRRQDAPCDQENPRYDSYGKRLPVLVALQRKVQLSGSFLALDFAEFVFSSLEVHQFLLGGAEKTITWRLTLMSEVCHCALSIDVPSLQQSRNRRKVRCRKIAIYDAVEEFEN